MSTVFGMIRIPGNILLDAGGRSIRDFRILSNRQQVLTKDSAGDVALWDVLHVR